MLLFVAASTCIYGEAKKGSTFVSDGSRMDVKHGIHKNGLSSARRGRQMSDWNREPHDSLILGRGFKEVKFINGTAHSDPAGSACPTCTAENFFKQAPSTAYYGPGYIASDDYPFYVWYEFKEPIIPGRISFRSTGTVLSPTTWFFVGSNDKRCGRYSVWTPLCGEVSGSPAESMKTPLFCHVKSSLAKPYRCLGIMVFKSNRGSANDNMMDVLNCKMWKVVTVDEDPWGFITQL